MHYNIVMLTYFFVIHMQSYLDNITPQYTLTL